MKSNLLKIRGLCISGEEKQKKLKYLIQDIEEQINLYKYGSEHYATDKSDTLLLETIESIIKERS